MPSPREELNSYLPLPPVTSTGLTLFQPIALTIHHVKF